MAIQGNMADKPESVEQVVIDHKEEEEEEEEEEGERWLKHYSSNHQILLVGDGDFSFSLSLALSFRSASNIVASSLDSYDAVIKKYKKAKSNLEILKKLGAQILHQVDATKMRVHTDLKMRKFDRIIYNFPHAGFFGKEDEAHLIKMHRNLVRGFFKNASGMLRPNGEIHVSHKTTIPFCCWDIEELASQNSLALSERVAFKREDYPGYNNKRGDGGRSDEPFPLGEASTFKFVLSTAAKKSTKSNQRCLSSHHGNPQPCQFLPFLTFPQPFPFAATNPTIVSSHTNDCQWIFREYFEHALSTFGQADDGLSHSVHETLRISYERFSALNPERPLIEYINLLEELHRLSKLRLAFLRNQLLDNGHELLATKPTGN